MPGHAVSVVIPTFNRAHFLGQSLESVLAQTIAPSQVVVVDDGSVDDTAGVVARFGDRIEYVRKENGGKSAALNIAMPRVRGDYLWIFDDDDVALPHAIEAHLEVLTARPDVGFTYSPLVEAAGEPGAPLRVLRETTLPPVADEAVFVRLLEGCFFTMQGILARTQCYRDVGPFDEALMRSQDYEMMLRLAHRYRATRLQRPTFLRRNHEGMRGGLTAQHGSADRKREWAKYDQIFSRKYYGTLPLNRYLPGDERNAALTPQQRRAALLQRMCIMARKGLWDYAVDDLEAIAGLTGQAWTMTADERAVCSRALVVDNFFAFAPILRDKSLARRFLAACHRALDADMRAQLARTLYYEVRHFLAEKEYGVARDIGAFALRLAGVGGVLAVLRQKIWRRLRPSDA